jgi:hypothetical protein
MKSDGKTEEIRENMPQCHSFHHKSHINWTGIEPGLLPELWNVLKLAEGQKTFL